MTDQIKEIITCEVCDNNKLVNIINLGNHPLCDDLIPVESKTVCDEFPIEILYCDICKTAHQRFQVKKESLFPTSYHYRARFTGDVLNGMRDLANNCIDYFSNKKNKTVLDIGCNDGSLLNIFSEYGFKTIGVEPTGAAGDAKKNEHYIYNQYFSTDTAMEIVKTHGKPDLITFTNVFAHIDNLNNLLNSLSFLMSNSTILVIENHYLGEVINKTQFDTFYHEHPRTYSLNSFDFISKKLQSNLFKFQFPKRYGGNIRVFISKSFKKNSDIEIVDEKFFFDELKNFDEKIKKWKIKKSLQIDKLFKEQGKLSAKAFPGRAAILVKLLELDHDKIDSVYEKPGSLKIDHYVPGTRIPIKSDEELLNHLEKRHKPIINFAWHIEKEIKKYLVSNDYKGNILNIVDFEDFN